MIFAVLTAASTRCAVMLNLLTSIAQFPLIAVPAAPAPFFPAGKQI
jgi:hypothetical protein